MSKSTLSTVITPELAIAACRVAGKDLDRDLLPQTKTAVGIDVTVRLVGALTFGASTFQAGQVRWKSIAAVLLAELRRVNPISANTIICALQDTQADNVRPEFLDQAESTFSSCRAPAAPRAGAIGGQIEVEVIG